MQVLVLEIQVLEMQVLAMAAVVVVLDRNSCSKGGW
jgi:hypothetical protein